ncbi:hypothetical protein CEXT_721731 [Caerostris extrusa]|uniref:Uncharacterized protein n=1 Tax=Caerostris extrusa TaxID=172846 RepID=A0AAV4SKT0_CAEEX|nr:hypothetical protein CEXT_721731 [Caerostris extrusa]
MDRYCLIGVSEFSPIRWTNRFGLSPLKVLSCHCFGKQADLVSNRLKCCLVGVSEFSPIRYASFGLGSFESLHSCMSLLGKQADLISCMNKSCQIDVFEFSPIRYARFGLSPLKILSHIRFQLKAFTLRLGNRHIAEGRGTCSTGRMCPVA